MVECLFQHPIEDGDAASHMQPEHVLAHPDCVVRGAVPVLLDRGKERSIVLGYKFELIHGYIDTSF
ncbi:hypothetical protein GCM10009655_12670 [Rhodoglobus aureus]|uniref:Uncharacterized protein n=1 Tax=Rhodoglobus aureus TaxID=191497 RepID=A0ABP4G810_9MICO